MPILLPRAFRPHLALMALAAVPAAAQEPALADTSTRVIVNEAARNRYFRSIERGGADRTPGLWLAVGDSISVRVADRRCMDDYCTTSYEVVEDDGWTVADSSVARLIPSMPDPAARTRHPQLLPRRLVGVRPGRTRVTVTGLRSSADTLPGAGALPRELTREVLVTPRVGRVEIALPPAPVRAGERTEIRAGAFDRAGREIPDAPVYLGVGREGGPGVQGGLSPIRLVFPGAGRYVVSAEVGAAADTAVIEVLPAPVAGGEAEDRAPVSLRGRGAVHPHQPHVVQQPVVPLDRPRHRPDVAPADAAQHE